MIEPITLFGIWTIACMQLSSMHCDVRQGVGAQVMRVVHHAHFGLNKLESLNITFWYNGLPLIIFDHAFHISSTKPNPCTNFSHNDNVHSQFATLIGKVHVKCNIVGLIGHIWPLKTIIESIYLSQFTSYYGVPLCFL